MQIDHLIPLVKELGPLKGVVHIAGSKGKGTTAHLLAKLLELQEQKVGLFTSPHILEREEMVMVNHEPIGKEKLETLISALPKTEPALSEFESIFLAALQVFKDESCDYIILEAGWGGELDASNAITEKELCILTHVEAEHLGIIGDSIEEIVQSQLGICREGTPLLTLTDHDDLIQAEIDEKVETMGLDLILAPSLEIGHHHPSCTGLALTALQQLAFTPRAEDIQELEAFVIPGRFERVSFGPHTLILDGAHTPDSLADLETQVTHYCFENGLPEPQWALHFLSDKDPQLYKLFPYNRSVWIPLEDERAGENYGSFKESSLEELMEGLRKKAKPECLAIAGSFRLVAEVKNLLDIKR